MYVPAGMQILSACGSMRSVPDWVLKDQAKELRSETSSVAKALRIAAPLSDEVAAAYNLGLQVARVMMRMNVPLIQAGVDPEKVL